VLQLRRTALRGLLLECLSRGSDLGASIFPTLQLGRQVVLLLTDAMQPILFGIRRVRLIEECFDLRRQPRVLLHHAVMAHGLAGRDPRPDRG
jgi:hypothetical protein